VTEHVRTWARDTEEVAPVVAEADPGLFEHRAMLAFRALAAIYVVGIVLAFFPEPDTISLLLALTFNAAALVLAITYYVIQRGLRYLQPWAVAVARPVLILIILEDLAVLVMSVAEGRIRLPIATVIAGWALLGRAGVKPIPWPRVFSWVVLGLAAPMLAVLVFARPLFGWGGVLDVQQRDLVARVTASCAATGDTAGGTTAGGANAGGAAATAGVPPSTIRLTYDWAWRKGTPVPSGLDVVVIGWTGDDAQGRPLYLLGPSLPTPAGIYDGRRRFPSLEMGNAVAAQSRGSWQWGIELDEFGIQPGRIEVDLQRAREATPGSQPLRIMVSYVHLGLWHVDEPVTCSW
jgi:hypothetical protein